MPGADRDGLTAGPADRLQAVGGAIVALDSGLGHMSESSDSNNETASSEDKSSSQEGTITDDDINKLNS